MTNPEQRPSGILQALQQEVADIHSSVMNKLLPNPFCVVDLKQFKQALQLAYKLGPTAHKRGYGSPIGDVIRIYSFEGSVKISSVSNGIVRAISYLIPSDWSGEFDILLPYSGIRSWLSSHKKGVMKLEPDLMENIVWLSTLNKRNGAETVWSPANRRDLEWQHPEKKWTSKLEFYPPVNLSGSYATVHIRDFYKFKEFFRYIEHAIDYKSSRFYFGAVGVELKISEGHMTMTTTDTYRMARAMMAVQYTGDPIRVVIEALAINKLASMLVDSVWLNIPVAEPSIKPTGDIVAHSDNWDMILSPWNDNFGNSEVAPSMPQNTHLLLNVGEIYDILDNVELSDQGDYMGEVTIFPDGQLFVTTEKKGSLGGNLGKIWGSMQVYHNTQTTSNRKVKFNLKYLADFLSAIRDKYEERFTLSFNDEPGYGCVRASYYDIHGYWNSFPE